MPENKIQKGFVFSIALLFFGTSAMGTFNAHNSSPAPILGTTLYVGGGGSGNYTNIQDAIDDASDGYTIVVYPGTYNEDQITIDKALNITSVEGWSTTIIDGGDATLSDCGLVRIIANGDVTFQGFTVQNAGGPSNGGDNGDDLTNVGIYTQSDSSTAIYTISNNKILGTNNPDDWEDYGFYTNSGQEHLIFKDNVVTQTAANAVLIEKHLGNTELSYNTLDAGCWGIDPIYCMTYGGTDITTLQKISHNTIDVSTGINPHGSGDNKVTGLGFSSAYLGCQGSDDSGKYTNIEISYNTIHNLQAYERGIALDNFAWGDGAGGEISNAVIQGNIIEGISTSSPSFAIRLSGLVSDTDIQGNIITGCDKSFYGTTGFYGDSTAYPTGTTIQDNNFEGNGGGLVWDGDPLNAQDNWWGNASGPQASGNPDGTGDPITGDVDYTPWLLHPYGPPYAAFTYTVDDKTVTFDASTSGDYDGTITTYDWNFGDTTNGQGITISHEYSAYQQYTATLTVTDNDDRTNSVSHTFTLSDHVRPVINNVQAVPNPQHVGKWVNISCKVTDNVAVSQVKVNITYPDASTINQTMTYNSVTHLAKYNITYSQLGVYDYFIWASDTSGNTKVSTVHSFQITNQAPYIPSSPSPSNGTTGVDVNAVLSWVGGDPDSGDTVTYDVFFGTSSSPPKVVGNQSSTSYDPPGTMQYSTTYYWKIVAWDNNGAFAKGSMWHFMTEGNSPPVFGAPSPSNGSYGEPLSLSWSIPINDPDGDLFSWTIQCSNGQTNSGSSASNGTKTLAPSGLSYSKTYTVWVNATDPTGSGLYTRRWYTFTTKASQPPVFGTPTPSNGSYGEPSSLTWSIPISDPEGDLFSWSIQCSNGQTNSGSGASNGTKSLALSGLSYSKTYTVWVNATDPLGSGVYTRMWYEFSTEGNYPPVFGVPSPSNGSTGEPLSLTWSISISDPDGDLFSWTIQCSNGQTNSGSSASNGTKTLSLSGLSYGTTYKVWVNATDPTGSGLYTRRWYTFTTKVNQPPIFGEPNPANGSSGNPLGFTWSIPINDPEGDLFSWTIQLNNGQAASGTSASNGTKSLVLSGPLAYNTTYKVWVNATDPGGSNTYTRKWYTFTTRESLPPVFGTPIPSNNSIDNPLSLTWSIPINDPEGDSFDWTIQCSNGQTNGGSGASNGTKTLSLSGLSYSTTYKIWVNATDPDGSGHFTRMWYLFTTHVNNPPYSPSDPSPSDGASNVNITTDVSWTGGDPDSDTVTYDVAFGTTTPPIIVTHNQSQSSYDPGTLAYNTTYYWQIIAWDDHGASTKGPIWSFTTEIGQDTTPPHVALTAPLPGYIYFNWRDVFLLRIPFFMTIVIGNINVVANASDAQSGIQKVEFWVNDDLRCTDTTAPYNWTWSEKGIFQETLRIVAYDNAGNQNHTSLTLWKIKILQK